MIYDCIVIGAGPAGLMAGCSLSQTKSLILEGTEKAAQKLLLSGAGQCNFTHDGDIRTFFERFGDQAKFVRKALSGFTNAQSRAFFDKQGIKSLVREDGKVFPESMDAWDVFRGLREHAKQNGVTIQTAEKVVAVSKEDAVFRIETGNKVYQSKTLIIAAGGASYPMTGSDGSGHALAKGLGHKIVPARPALTPVYIQDFQLVDLAGNSFKNGKIVHYREQKKVGEYRGDILITHTGLSGPGILDNSRYMSSGDELRLNFLNDGVSRETLEKELLNGNKKQVKTILSEYMTKRNGEKLIELSRLDKEQTCAELSKKDRKTLLKNAEGYSMIIRQLGNMKSAMVTAGGVSTKEVIAGSMASKLVEGLYFAGEVLDVDGDSGGFNIQWAFSSGRLAGQSAKAYLAKQNE